MDLQYNCENCRRHFSFDDYIEFCPYCGKMLNGMQSGALTAEGDLTKTIDLIWGNSASLKRELFYTVIECIESVNSYVNTGVAKTLSTNSNTKYERKYRHIRKSSGRKTLLSRIASFLRSLGTIIDKLPDSVPEHTIQELNRVVSEKEEMAKELYDFLNMRYTPASEPFFVEGKEVITFLYSREQIRALYEAVLVAFDKYKRCVEDNNMFAAFASSSDYGKLDGESADQGKGKGNPTFERVLAHMQKENDRKYFGLLDEEFRPHVDAFWYGLGMLCKFIDTRVDTSVDATRFYIGEKETAKIHRAISDNGFYISEARVESAEGIKERFSERLEALQSNDEDEEEEEE
jgi:hypothetical protein